MLALIFTLFICYVSVQMIINLKPSIVTCPVSSVPVWSAPGSASSPVWLPLVEACCRCPS
jgi:hypothetical protein